MNPDWGWTVSHSLTSSEWIKRVPTSKFVEWVSATSKNLVGAKDNILWENVNIRSNNSEVNDSEKSETDCWWW